MNTNHPLWLNILLYAPPLLVAVICHEVAHGWVAEKLGDPTARRLGRITLNPLVHIDPWMTIILPALLIYFGSPVVFGGAKAVPINPMNFKNPRRGMAYVAMAGPITNFTLVALLWLLSRFLDQHWHALNLSDFQALLLITWVSQGMLINLVLGLFNLIPIPPLDGGRVAVGFLPASMARLIAKLEPFGLLIVFYLLASGAVGKILNPIIRALAIRLLQ